VKNLDQNPDPYRVEILGTGYDLDLLALREALLAAGPRLANEGHGLDGGPVLAQARHHLVH